jgi:hypothetical protein
MRSHARRISSRYVAIVPPLLEVAFLPWVDGPFGARFHHPRLSHFMPLRRPTPAGPRGFPLWWARRVSWQILGGDEHAAQSCEHVGHRWGVLGLIRGALARWAAASAGASPASAHQQIVRLRHSRPNGTVRSTARRVRLRPVGAGDLAGVFEGDLVAYRSTRSAGWRPGRWPPAQLVAVRTAGWAGQDDLHRLGAEGADHRQRQTARSTSCWRSSTASASGACGLSGWVTIPSSRTRPSASGDQRAWEKKRCARV